MPHRCGVICTRCAAASACLVQAAEPRRRSWRSLIPVANHRRTPIDEPQKNTDEHSTLLSHSGTSVWFCVHLWLASLCCSVFTCGSLSLRFSVAPLLCGVCGSESRSSRLLRCADS